MTRLLLTALRQMVTRVALGPVHPSALKLALIVRADLRLSKGKAAAQCAHAAIACFQLASRQHPAQLTEWLASGQPKIVLRCDSLAELELLLAGAQRAGLVAASIRDAGRTQVAAGTCTVLGIGPADAAELDALVGKLKLL